MANLITKFCFVAAFALISCGDDGTPASVGGMSNSQASIGGSPVASGPVTAIPLPTVQEADGLVAVRHPLEARAIAASGGAINANGLIGRNRQYGRLVSPRFQLGAGAALRLGLHLDPTLANNGFRAIEVGTSAIASDGAVQSDVPPDAPAGTTLDRSDLASGAAFFMADACPALLALQAHPNADTIAEPRRRETVIAVLGRGLNWLIALADDLERVDRAAPNRLLYDALAYHSCGVLTGNNAAQTHARRFVALALSQTRTDGVFIEKGGSDTSYQAVSVRLAADLLLTGYAATDSQTLNNRWQAGAIWLGNRILADGRIDSSANTRTCHGGESFLGVEKTVSAPGVYGAMIYMAELASNDGLKSAAARLSAWAQANPNSDGCT